MSAIVWIGSTTLLVVGNEVLLTDEISQERISDADVQATITNESTGGTIGPIALSAVSGVPGRYRGVVPYNQSGLNVGDRLSIEYFIDAGSSKRLTIVEKAVAKKRTA